MRILAIFFHYTCKKQQKIDQYDNIKMDYHQKKLLDSVFLSFLEAFFKSAYFSFG